MLEKAVYNTPTVSADSTSTAMNMDFMKDETYPCTSGECNKHFSHKRSLTRQKEAFHDQEEGKCQRKCKRTMNEHEYALKEVNRALRWF